MKPTPEDLRQQIATLEKYAELKLKARDWHGVRDCAVDIEILEAQLKIVETKSVT